jgi:hypothetical protein
MRIHEPATDGGATDCAHTDAVRSNGVHANGVHSNGVHANGVAVNGAAVNGIGNKSSKRAWWKESSVYQIYPASFKDSTGSGSGDLGGIIDRVDYIHELGVDIVWICPIFESPQVDMVGPDRKYTWCFLPRVLTSGTRDTMSVTTARLTRGMELSRNSPICGSYFTAVA